MKGHNKIRLCKAEMNEAIQHYLDNVVFSEKYKVIVDDVSAIKDSPLKSGDLFEISLIGVMEDERKEVH